MNRKESNIDLLNILEYLIEKHPDLRFSQILQSYGFVKPNRPTKDQGQVDWQNEFYSEPDEILKRVKGKLNNDF